MSGKSNRLGRGILTHNVHASQLRPDLGEKTKNSAVQHLRLEEIDISDIGVTALKLAHVLDVLQFVGNERMVWITLAVDKSQNIPALFPPIFAGKPSWRFREEHHHEE